MKSFLAECALIPHNYYYHTSVIEIKMFNIQDPWKIPSFNKRRCSKTDHTKKSREIFQETGNFNHGQGRNRALWWSKNWSWGWTKGQEKGIEGKKGKTKEIKKCGSTSMSVIIFLPHSLFLIFHSFPFCLLLLKVKEKHLACGCHINTY